MLTVVSTPQSFMDSFEPSILYEPLVPIFFTYQVTEEKWSFQCVLQHWKQHPRTDIQGIGSFREKSASDFVCLFVFCLFPSYLTLNAITGQEISKFMATRHKYPI